MESIAFTKRNKNGWISYNENIIGFASEIWPQSIPKWVIHASNRFKFARSMRINFIKNLTKLI